MSLVETKRQQRRLNTPLNLKQYGKVNRPCDLGVLPALALPKEQQFVLRMCICAPYSDGYRPPAELCWLLPVMDRAALAEDSLGHRRPYCYVTVRHGFCNTELDDEWHVDGFSMKHKHFPDSNYIFNITDSEWLQTQWLAQSFDIPADFDPLRHNLHKLLQSQAEPQGNAHWLKSGRLYLLDPYVVHRRPPGSEGRWRTFVRISFTSVEIPDKNNTVNPHINTSHYTHDGLAFRNSLLKYGEDE